MQLHARLSGDPCVAPLPRTYHPEVVAVINRLIDGIMSKGPGEVIDMSNVAQARASESPCQNLMRCLHCLRGMQAALCSS